MATLIQQHSLVDVLLQKNFISRNTLEKILREIPAPSTGLQHYLLEHNVISSENLGKALAHQFAIPFYSLDEYRVEFDKFNHIPPDLMQRYLFLPLQQNISDGTLTIAFPDPHDFRTLDRLERLLDCPLNVVVATREAITQALAHGQENSQVLTRIQDDLRPLLIRENEHGDEVLTAETIGRDESPVVRLVNMTILSALQKRASDIHIEPTEHALDIKFRIDGILYLAMDPLASRFHNPIVSRLKVMSELDIAERRTPQDGRFKLKIDNRTVDFRVSILPSAFGESVVIRILAKEEVASGGAELRLDRLGFTPEDLRRFRRAITVSYGMVLVTGPTGSGKTTTLYGALNEVNSTDDKIITIEDPVEYQLKGVIQIPVNEKKGLTFARGLRSILRHDPDKIMVGEIRDGETAQIAIQSALTGHLVFTTVHANNAFDVIGRFVNMGIEPYNFVSSINCIMAQRLVRNLCQFCKAPFTITPSQCEEFSLSYDQFKDHTLFREVGCPECHGLGYRGRNAITEFLPLSDTIKELILDRRPNSEIRRIAVQEGMTTLREAGSEKVLQGQTTLKELNRVTFTG